MPTTVAVVVDVDGVVSAVKPSPGSLPWGDEVEVGQVFGPVLLSPTLCARLDALDNLPGVTCWWLTSWTSQMRRNMQLFPGARWQSVAEPDSLPAAAAGRDWWKLTAVERWLDLHPEIRKLAWCDDDLRGGRPAAVRRRLSNRGLLPPLLIAPPVAVGLTPADVTRLEAWAIPRPE